MPKNNYPIPGDNIWQVDMKNGQVIHVDREEQVVICKSLNDGETYEFSIDDVLGNWTEKLGGFWIVPY